MIKNLKYLSWILTKKFKILRGPYFLLISLKNWFKRDGWWVTSKSELIDFFSYISKCEYVYFSSLVNISNIEYNQDIDILFKIEDLSQITYKLKRGRPSPNAIRVDLYSLEGAYPYVYQGIAYFPPKLGKVFLEKAEIRSGMRVLSNEHQALSNLYREVYIKGLCKDEQFSNSKKVLESFKILNILINFNNLTFKFIDDYFAQLSFRPALDSIKSLSDNSDCLKATIENEFSKFESANNVLTIFIRNSELTETIVGYINNFTPYNYRIYKQGHLSKDEISLIKSETRGGNWFSDSFNVGGDPVYYFTFIDELTLFDLEKVKLYKTIVRKKFHQNIMHSADSSRESVYYYSLIQPDDYKKLI